MQKLYICARNNFDWTHYRLRKNQEPILLLGKEEIINDFDKIMNLFFYTMPHIINDKNNRSFIKYGPMTIEIGRSLAGPANSVHIYIDDSEA